MKTITLYMTLFLVGCTIGPAPGPTGKLLPVEDIDVAGEIFVIRSNSIVGFANSFYVAIDSVDIFAIKKGQCTKFKLQVGKYSFGMKHLGGGYQWKEDYIPIEVLPDSETYIVVVPRMNSIVSRIIDKKKA